MASSHSVPVTSASVAYYPYFKELIESCMSLNPKDFKDTRAYTAEYDQLLKTAEKFLKLTDDVTAQLQMDVAISQSYSRTNRWKNYLESCSKIVAQCKLTRQYNEKIFSLFCEDYFNYTLRECANLTEVQHAEDFLTPLRLLIKENLCSNPLEKNINISKTLIDLYIQNELWDKALEESTKILTLSKQATAPLSYRYMADAFALQRKVHHFRAKKPDGSHDLTLIGKAIFACQLEITTLQKIKDPIYDERIKNSETLLRIFKKLTSVESKSESTTSKPDEEKSKLAVEKKSETDDTAKIKQNLNDGITSELKRHPSISLDAEKIQRISELLHTSIIALQTNDFPKSIACSTQAIELCNGLPLRMPYIHRYFSAVELGNYKAAMADAEILISFDMPMGYLFKGVCLVGEKNWAEARDNLIKGMREENAARTPPSTYKNHVFSALTNCAQALEQKSPETSKDKYGFILEGCHWFKKGDNSITNPLPHFQRAVVAFTQATCLDTTRVESTYYLRGLAHYFSKNTRAALDDLHVCIWMARQKLPNIRSTIKKIELENNLKFYEKALLEITKLHERELAEQELADRASDAILEALLDSEINAAATKAENIAADQATNEFAEQASDAILELLLDSEIADAAKKVKVTTTAEEAKYAVPGRIIKLHPTAADSIIRLKKVGATLTAAVGGIVRDPEIKRDIIKLKKGKNGTIRRVIDIDIVTEASLEQIRQAYPESEGFYIQESEYVSGLYTVGNRFKRTDPEEHLQIMRSKYFTDPKYKSDPYRYDALSRDFYHNAIYSNEHGQRIAPLGKKTIDALDTGTNSIINRKELFDFEGKNTEGKSAAQLAYEDDARRVLRGRVTVITYDGFKGDEEFNDSVSQGLMLLNRQPDMINSLLIDKIFSNVDAANIFDKLTHTEKNTLFPKLFFSLQVNPELKKLLNNAINQNIYLENMYACFIILENYRFFNSLSIAKKLEFQDDRELETFFMIHAADNPFYKACFEGYSARMQKLGIQAAPLAQTFRQCIESMMGYSITPQNTAHQSPHAHGSLGHYNSFPSASSPLLHGYSYALTPMPQDATPPATPVRHNHAQRFVRQARTHHARSQSGLSSRPSMQKVKPAETSPLNFSMNSKEAGVAARAEHILAKARDRELKRQHSPHVEGSLFSSTSPSTSPIGRSAAFTPSPSSSNRKG